MELGVLPRGESAPREENRERKRAGMTGSPAAVQGGRQPGLLGS